MTSDRRQNKLTALDALEQIKSGASTSEALVESCLARIQEREDIVGAWAILSPNLALDAARATNGVTPLHAPHQDQGRQAYLGKEG